ncbi:MAG: heme o synthase [Acidobacteriota bacterium]
MKPMTAADRSASTATALKIETVEPGRAGLATYLDLTKPRITVLVVLSALAGFVMGSPQGVDYLGLLHTAVGISLLASGIAALNQYLERELDGRMRRTQTRPLPAGLLSPDKALVFGIVLSVVAELYLAYFLNPLTAFLGLVALGSYLFVYTPLKTRTTWCTFIGAIPGALPPLLGWTGATNQVGIEAVVLFGILFLWQFPHFHAIASLYREDYERAGIRMLPVVEPDGRRTAREIVLYTVALIPVSMLPTALKLSGSIYLAGAIVLGLWFLYVGLRAAKAKSKASARVLLRASVIYLPLLLLLMILDR